MAHTLAGALRRRTLTAAAAFALAALLAIAFSSSALGAYCKNGDPAGSEARLALKSVPVEWWVSAELGYGGANRGMLRARSSLAGDWETFTIRCLGWDQFALRAANGKYVSVEMGYTGDSHWMLRARADTIGAWEKFTWDRLEADGLTLPAEARIKSLANDRLVAVEFSYSGDNWAMLRASGGWFNTFEVWARR